MTNLTDKWKKGELPEGDYWVKHDGVINILDELEISLTSVDEVLDKVPSYEEWIMTKNLSERAHLEMYKARGEKVKLEKENTKLKELLKELKGYYDADGKYYIEKRILLEINQALGEE